MAMDGAVVDELFWTPMSVSSEPSNALCVGSRRIVREPSGWITIRIAQPASKPTAGHCLKGGVGFAARTVDGIASRHAPVARVATNSEDGHPPPTRRAWPVE